MMRKITILVAVAAAILLAVTAGAKNDKFLVATGIEVMTSMQMGELKCIGGSPTGLPLPPCTPGTQQIHIRGQIEHTILQSVDGPAKDLLAGGVNTVVNNCNLDGDYQGHCWGTFELSVPAAGGKWEGSWEGKFDLTTSLASYSATGHGSGGKLEGLHVKYDAASTVPFTNPSFTATVH